MSRRSRRAALGALALAASSALALLPGSAAIADIPVRGAGVWVTSTNGTVEAFGDAPAQGSVTVGPDVAVDLTPTPTGRGYWVLTGTGRVLTRGDAVSYGNAPLGTQGSFVAIAGTPSGQGYWLMTSKGQLIALGDAPALSRTTPATKASTVDLVATPNGLGAWTTSNQGEVSAFGAAPVLAAPSTKSSVVAIQSSPTGQGYLLATTFGQVVRAGDAVQRGDLSGRGVTVIDLAATYDGRGYWLLLSDRTIRAFGSAVPLGPSQSTSTVTALASTPFVNRAPVAVDDSATTLEDTPTTVDVGTNDSDPDNDPLTFSVSSAPAHGTFELVSGSQFRYTPAPDYFGADSATYQAADPFGGTALATVRFTVQPVNDPPVAADDSATTAEDTSVLIDVLGNDTDVDSTLTAAVQNPPEHGAVTAEPGGLRYTPDVNFNGLDGFTYVVDDGSGGTDTAEVTVQVTAVDDVPVATADSFQVPQGSTLAVEAPGVLANDSDVDGDALTAELVSGPATGQLVLDPDGGFTWTPPESSTAADSFTYRAVGAGTGSAPVTVSLTVVPSSGGGGTGGGGFGGSARPVEITNQDTYDITAYGTPVNDLELGTVQRSGGRILYAPDPDVQGNEHLVFADGRTLDIEVVDEDDG